MSHPCQTVIRWLKQNLGSKCCAPLTHTDAKALFAAVQIVELYAYAPSRGVADAFKGVVETMQPHTRELAYHAIAHVMDWSTREELWSDADLPELKNRRVCTFEPNGSAWKEGA